MTIAVFTCHSHKRQIFGHTPPTSNVNHKHCHKWASCSFSGVWCIHVWCQALRRTQQSAEGAWIRWHHIKIQRNVSSSESRLHHNHQWVGRQFCLVVIDCEVTCAYPIHLYIGISNSDESLQHLLYYHCKPIGVLTRLLLRNIWVWYHTSSNVSPVLYIPQTGLGR